MRVQSILHTANSPSSDTQGRAPNLRCMSFLKILKHRFTTYFKDEQASVPVEYGVIALLMAAFLITIWGQTGNSLGEMYEGKIGASMKAAVQGANQ